MAACYFLYTTNLSHACNGSYAYCMALAQKLTECGEHELLILARARAGEPHAISCFEITASGFKQTRGLRTEHRKTLSKLSKSSPLVGSR